MTAATRYRIDEVGHEALDAVMAVMDRAFDSDHGEAWNRGQCLAMLGLPGVWLALARDADGTALGFSLCRAVLDEAELMLIATLPEARGTGVGGALLSAAASSAARRGAVTLHLEVRDDNPAIDFYERRGFGRIGRRPGYYRGTGGVMRDAITLARALGPA